jgi:hypothetical protein
LILTLRRICLILDCHGNIINKSFPYAISPGNELYLGYLYNSPQTIIQGDDLILDNSNSTAELYPPEDGSIYIALSNGIFQYTYESRIPQTINHSEQPQTFTLHNIQPAAGVAPKKSFIISFAAQKTIIQYLRAGNMGAQIPLGSENFVFTGTADAIKGNLADNTLSFGNNLTDSSSSYWYGGDADICYCVDGKYKFGIGVRVYYEFTFTTPDSSSDSTARADGYFFSIVNGTNNSKNSTGGAPAGTSMGELLGYAGPERSDGNDKDNGLRPPQMGIEFDTYPNYRESDICKPNSRNDPTDNKNHMALMYWSDNPTGSCTIGGTSYLKSTFDDNQHGTGGSGGYPPANSIKSDGTGGFYAGAKNGSYNWLEDNTLHRFRLEIIRAASPNVDDTYSYTTKAWVDCAGCSDSQLATFKDLTVAYSDRTPQINRIVTLTPADHQAFDTMLFGWSEATGSSTQTIKFQNFNMFCAKSTCAYGTK